MTTPATSTAPVPAWEPNTLFPRRDALLEGLYRQREAIMAHWPGLLLPGRSPRLQAGAAPTPPTHAAAVILAWERVPKFSGPCHACGGPMIGVAFGGGYFQGLLHGACVQCGAQGQRWINGFAEGVRLSQAAVAGTPWRLGLGNMRWLLGGRAPALRAVLGELGEAVPASDELLVP